MISHGKDIKVFTGNSNPKLAEEICRLMGTKLGESEVGTFSDGEIFSSLYETVRGSDVFVVQSTCTPVNNNLMELLIMIDALKRASAGRITAVIPYFGYARQDRKAKARDPITAKLVANMITTAGADRVLTMDLHANQIQGFFDIPVDNLAAKVRLRGERLEALFGNLDLQARSQQVKGHETGIVSGLLIFGARITEPRDQPGISGSLKQHKNQNRTDIEFSS